MDNLQITDEQVLERLRPAVKRKRKGKRPAFKSRWVKLPVRWVEALGKSTSASTYRHGAGISNVKREGTGASMAWPRDAASAPASSVRMALLDQAEPGGVSPWSGRDQGDGLR